MRIPLFLTGAAALFSSTAVQAQSCAALRAQMDGLNGDLLATLGEYPATHAMLATCFMGQGRSQQQRNECANGALRTACFFMGSADCNALMERWRRVATAKAQVEAAMRRQGCN